MDKVCVQVTEKFQIFLQLFPLTELQMTLVQN